MEQLALFALPRSYKDEEEDANSNEAAAKVHSDSQSREIAGQDALSWTSNLSNEANKDQNVPDIEMFHDPLPSAQDDLYPWSRKQLSFGNTSAPCPLPRYGMVSSQACKNGQMYFYGGLVDGSTVHGDLWLVTGIDCESVATTSEGPGPRVGGCALHVGNAFIVFGGDTEGDELDGLLYFLNTCKSE